jgi:hypothetical protein
MKEIRKKLQRNKQANSRRSKNKIQTSVLLIQRKGISMLTGMEQRFFWELWNVLEKKC